MSKNTSNRSDSYVPRRAYANPTEDQAIANIMREERQKERRLRHDQKNKQRAGKKYPGGVWRAEE